MERESGRYRAGKVIKQEIVQMRIENGFGKSFLIGNVLGVGDNSILSSPSLALGPVSPT